MTIFVLRELSKLAALGCVFLAAWTLSPSDHQATSQAITSGLTASAACAAASCVLFAAGAIASAILPNNED